MVRTECTIKIMKRIEEIEEMKKVLKETAAIEEDSKVIIDTLSKLENLAGREAGLYRELKIEEMMSSWEIHKVEYYYDGESLDVYLDDKFYHRFNYCVESYQNSGMADRHFKEAGILGHSNYIEHYQIKKNPGSYEYGTYYTWYKNPDKELRKLNRD